MQFLKGQSFKDHGMRRKLTIAVLLGGCAVLGGIGLSGGSFTHAVSNAEGILTEGIGQTAWRQAMAQEPAHPAWPWETASAEQTASRQTVRQLGFSAVLSNNASIDSIQLAELTRADKRDHLAPRPAVMTGPAQVNKADDLAVGDRITVVTPDGLSHLYKVTAREATPANAKGKLGKVTGKALATKNTQADCSTLSSFVAGAMRLVIEAVQTEPVHRPHTTPEQKL